MNAQNVRLTRAFYLLVDVVVDGLRMLRNFARKVCSE